jgi:hypothetical protein
MVTEQTRGIRRWKWTEERRRESNEPDRKAKHWDLEDYVTLIDCCITSGECNFLLSDL